jgi:hypothetical protein
MASHASPAGSSEPLPGSPEAKEATPGELGAPTAPMGGGAKDWDFFAQLDDDELSTDEDEDEDSKVADDSDEDSPKRLSGDEEVDAEWEDLFAEDECPDDRCAHPQCQGWDTLDADEEDADDGIGGDGSDDDGDGGYETP